jgi:hypothetical protein
MFLEILNRMLDDPECQFVEWQSSNQFKVHRQLAVETLPNYFKTSKFKSFVRQLNMWGFRGTMISRDIMLCKHHMFWRGMHDFSGMKRQKVKDTQKTTQKIRKIGRPRLQVIRKPMKIEKTEKTAVKEELDEFKLHNVTLSPADDRCSCLFDPEWSVWCRGYRVHDCYE